MPKKNGKKQNIFFRIIFIIGFCLMLFPIVSQGWYFYISHQDINKFEKEASDINKDEIERRLELAQAYNSSLKKDGKSIEDPYTNIQKEGRSEYARMLKIHEQIGYVSIPSINTEVPIFAGSSEAVLQKGAGHLEGTSLPVGGSGTHTVITAHNGLPTAQLFTDLNKVKVGDIFYIKNIKETLAYRVDQIKVVEPGDLDEVSIEDNKDYATLLTCTPYMINSHRLLVRGERIAYNAETKQEIKRNIFKNSWIQLVLVVVGVTALTIIVRIYKKRKLKH